MIEYKPTIEQSTIGNSVCLLINRARSGCDNSMAELFGQLATYMRLVAGQKVDRSIQAKVGYSDIVQQSCAVAVEKFTEFRGVSESELFAWVRQIFVNELKQQRRSLNSDKRNVQREVRMADNRSTEFNAPIADRHPTPGTMAIRKEQSQAVLDALSKLSLEDQQVIRLRNWQKLPFNEIGRQMNRSENSATKLWYRALLRLEQQLETGDD